MATILNNNIYPPIVPDTLPTFIRTSNCNIYFGISMYNDLNKDISSIQLSVIDQRTNSSALKTDLYPSGIKVIPKSQIQKIDNSTSDYNYCISINPKEDLKSGVFELNRFYKVQLRFTAAGIEAPSSGQQLATWLYENMAFFSEWSKVCLIKGIQQPKFMINGFDENQDNGTVTFSTPFIQVVGKMYFDNSNEIEYLKTYNIKIYETNNPANIVVNSGDLYPDSLATNEFNYTIKYDLLDSIEYTLMFTYVTNNLYTQNFAYNFIVIQNGVDKISANIIATSDVDNGRVKIQIVAKDSQKFIGNLTIRRSSSKSDFHKWEDVKTVTYMSHEDLNYEWFDYTVESGIWYKYCAQKRDTEGNRGAVVMTEKPVMCIFDDMFLNGGGRQLKLQLDPIINNFKYNVTESQQVTLGSKYPYIKRNSDNYYRSFSIGGLISSFIDTTDWYDPHFYNGNFHNNENEIGLFTTKEEIYGQSLQNYNNYNNNNNINDYQDYVYEKEFRQKVYDFLYKHNVKLFRSTTEGNILVKLMDITFEPNQTLGRRLYSFSATAIEVDEANIENYDKYKIQEVGDYSKYIMHNYDSLGQITGTFDESNGNVIESLISKRFKNESSINFLNEVKNLKWLKLEIESEPYVIIEENGSLIKATENSNIVQEDATFGYIVIINGTEMIVKARKINYDIDRKNQFSYTAYQGFLELKQSNTEITDLKFKYPTTVTINYVANVDEIEDTSHQVSRLYYYNRVGQLYGTFKPNDSLMTKIYDKYDINFREYYQRLVEVKDIKIEGPQGAVVYVKDSKDADFNKHILNNNFLQLKDDDAIIEGIYFCGIKLQKSKDPLSTISGVNGLTEFTPQPGIFNNLNEIENPINGGIYQLKSYAIIDAVTMENNILYFNNNNSIQHQQINKDNVYTILENEITDDDNLKFVYYYGCWYVLSKAYDKIKLLKGDIRTIREGQFIEFTDKKYNYAYEVENPINNGVYDIRYLAVDGISFNEYTGLLITKSDGVLPNNLLTETDNNYALLLKTIINKSNKHIYYHGEWYPFTQDNQVLCPVDGIIDYYCKIEKGVYKHV